MKRLAMILAVAFTMGLAASTVTAGTKDTTKKDKKECCAKAKDCAKDAKKSCCGAKPAPAPAQTPVPAKK